MELDEIHPLAVVFGLVGLGIGILAVKSMGGGGLGLGEASYDIGIMWKILIPITCAGASFLLTNKMFQ